MEALSPSLLRMADASAGSSPIGASEQNSNRSYRADIDGLRGIAVIAVILFHLDRSFMPHGYLGVDIFFVISGFLITRIIRREVEDGAFSFARFFERRLRRILPALLCMLLVTTGAALLLMLPSDLVAFAKSLFASLAFAGNIYFLGQADYFGKAAESMPLLHLWSLGVEEQFYLFFPVVLVPCLRKLDRRAAALVILALILVSSAAAAGSSTTAERNLAFYLLPQRTWELCFGALVALLPRYQPSHPAFVTGLSLLALAMISAALAGFAPSNISAQQLVVMGSSLLIYAGAGGHLSALSWQPLRAAGLMSFSLYLWHWPIIVLARYWLIGNPTIYQLGIMAAATGAVSTISWAWIERPFRTGSLARLLKYAAGGVTIVLSAGALILWHEGLPSRFSPAVNRVAAVIDTHYRCEQPDARPEQNVRLCQLGVPSSDLHDADVVLLGNSHMEMYVPLIDDILKTHHLKGMLVVSSGCLAMTNVNIASECFATANKQIEIATSLKKARVVIIGVRWKPEHGGVAYPDGRSPKGSTTDEVIAGLHETAGKLPGRAVLFVGPIATPGADIASMWSRSLAYGKSSRWEAGGSKAAFLQRYAPILAEPGLIRPDLVQCPDTECLYEINGQPIFSDDNHLAESSLSIFRKLFEKPIVSAMAGNI
ncbi:O-antigen acetylase [Sphingomonas sp. DBB INV C78]|uniref:acyltransferase family protein n=1 Tax=Sphingomonas sp. DBB INV C78 TaxID=3349434 RepID=UPI0036D36FED